MASESAQLVRPATGHRHLHLAWLPTAVAALWLVQPGAAGFTLCPFALVTGTACPGCGLTRAAGFLVRGDLGSALALHPLIPVVGVWLAVMWLLALGRSMGRRVQVDNRLVRALLVVTATAFVGVWLIRMAQGTLPPV